MRFKITREICVEVQSFDEVDELHTQLEDAIEGVAGDRHIKDPQDGSLGGGSVEGLDDESRAALESDSSAKGL